MIDVLMTLAVSLCGIKNKAFIAVGFDEAKNLVVVCRGHIEYVPKLKVKEFKTEKYVEPIPEPVVDEW